MTTQLVRAPDVAPFSEVVRTASRGEHEAAESSAFVTALFDGQLTVADYARLAGQTRFIYDVLEQATDAQRDDPVAGAFCFDELRRLDSIDRDLDALLGADWRATLTPLPATERYCERLRAVAFDWAGGFVAHHYTRYLGDLSGGQVIRRALERGYGLTDAGLEFYTFVGIPKPKPFKDRYRALLDAVPWDEAERARVVEEVNVAFRLNGALFADLAAARKRADHS